MAEFKSIDEAREYFAGDRFAAVNGMTIAEVSDDCCVCSCRIREEHRNAMGNVMGGVIFTLADFAFAVCDNNVHKPTTGMDADIRFLSAPKGAELIAKARVIKSGRTTTTVQVDVSDELGSKVALLTGTGFKL